MTPITITDKAWSHIRAISSEGKTLKIGLKKGGCAGLEYLMELVEAPSDHDLIIEGDKAKLIVDAKAQMFLFGMVVDYETGLIESGFKFSNPNISESCGCGESFKFDIDHVPRNSQQPD